MVQWKSKYTRYTEQVASGPTTLNKTNNMDSNHALALQNAEGYYLDVNKQELTFEKTEVAPSLMNFSVNPSYNSLGSGTVQVLGSTVNGFDIDVPKVLVVDDHAASRMTAVALLAMEGYEVIEADSGSTAVELVNQKQLDLILLDVMMPGMDGFEVCQLLKQDEHTRLIPVILITAFKRSAIAYQGN